MITCEFEGYQFNFNFFTDADDFKLDPYLLIYKAV